MQNIRGTTCLIPTAHVEITGSADTNVSAPSHLLRQHVVLSQTLAAAVRKEQNTTLFFSFCYSSFFLSVPYLPFLLFISILFFLFACIFFLPYLLFHFLLYLRIPFLSSFVSSFYFLHQYFSLTFFVFISFYTFSAFHIFLSF